MQHKRLWIIVAVGLVLALDVALLASARRLFVYSYTVESVTYEGDVILPATPDRRGPSYSEPYDLPICVYWTGVAIVRTPQVGRDPCPRLTR